jgi:hypothetical protein
MNLKKTSRQAGPPLGGAAGDVIAVTVEPRPGHSDEQVISALQSVGAIDITPLAPGFISARVAVPALSGMRQVAYVHAKPLNQLHA